MVTTALEIAARVVGVVMVITTLWSAMLTVVVPRAERPRLTRYHFKLMGALSKGAHRYLKSPELRDQFDSRLAPFGLITLSFVWASNITFGFAFIFWGQGIRGFVDALVLSGSSLTTLGIRTADTLPTLVLVVLEALIGLGLVGLVISYLPTVYSSYQERELAVARLEVRAGRPPHPVTMLARSHNIGWLDDMDSTWAEWEDWFLRIEESHTTHTSLPFFRSSYHERSWLQTAGVVLDAAALMESVVDVDPSPRAALCLRSGFMTLGSIADMFKVERPVDPRPNDPITLDRSAFATLCQELQAQGVPLRSDLDQAWIDFAGWRVNYEASLLGLFTYLRLEPGPWFGECNPIPAS